MDATGPTRREVVLLLAAVFVMSSAVYAYAGTLPFPPCPQVGSTGCESEVANVTYSTTAVGIPAPSTSTLSGGAFGAGPLTIVSFGGVNFRLWAEGNSTSVEFLQGSGTESNGIDLAFVVFASTEGIGGNPSPTNTSVRTWFAPDGEFGVIWLGQEGSTVEVELLVAHPFLVFAYENVSLPAGNASTSPPASFDFEGQHFLLQILGSFSPAGPSLTAVVTTPTGSTIDLGVWDGPAVACGLEGATPQLDFGNASCLEAGSPDHSVGFLWSGDLGVTLMVRTG